MRSWRDDPVIAVLGHVTHELEEVKIVGGDKAEEVFGVKITAVQKCGGKAGCFHGCRGEEIKHPFTHPRLEGVPSRWSH